MTATEPKSAAVAFPARAPLAGVVDELGALEKELAPLKTKIDRVEMLRKQIRVAYANDRPAEEIQAHGGRFVCILGPKGNQTVIDFKALVKQIKAASYAKFAVCTLAALKENVSEDVIAIVTRVEQTGPRSLKVLEKGTPG